MTDEQEFVGHIPDRTEEQKLIDRIKAKVRAQWDPAFVGVGKVDLGDGPYPGQEFKGRCSRCNTLNGVKWRFSRTAFEWDGKGENPNACIPMCDVCGAVYNKMMDRRWSEFFQNQQAKEVGDAGAGVDS